MGNEADSAPDGLLGLDNGEHDIRVEKLKKQVEEVAGEAIWSGKTAGCAPELEEAFLQNVLALEGQGFVRPFDELVAAGFSLTPPDELNETALTAKLWEVIGALAQRRLFLDANQLDKMISA